MSPRVRLLAKYGLALTAIAVLVAFVDVESLGEALRHADPLLVALGIAFGFASWLLNTWKWKRLLAAVGVPVRLAGLYRLNLVGALYGTVLPGQVAGEGAKMLKLSRQASDRPALVASVLVDRLTGLLGLTMLGMVCGLVAPGVPTAIRAILVAACVVSVVVVAVLVWWQLPVRPSREGRVARVAHQLRRSIAEYGTCRRELFLACLASLAFQLALTVNVAMFARALAIDAGVIDLGWIMAIVAVVQLVPLTVAAIGTRDVAFIVLLGLLGSTRAEAVALSVLVLLGNLALALAGGLSELLPERPLRVDLQRPAASERYNSA